MKYLKLFLHCLIFSGLFTFYSCKKEEFKTTNSDNVQHLKSSASFSRETRTAQPTILGRQKENPFSVENMRIALDTLIAYAKTSDSIGINPELARQVRIIPTDLYVRFLPADSTQYNKLIADTNLVLFDIPLDYEIKQMGDYYHEPS